MFPKLGDIFFSLSCTGEDVVDFLDATISPTLTSVGFQLHPHQFTPQEGEEDAILAAVAQAARTKVPDNRLKYVIVLAMHSQKISSTTMKELAHTIESQSVIQTLSLDIPSPGIAQVFEAASRLPLLHHAVLSLEGGKIWPDPPGIVSGEFTALRSAKPYVDGPCLSLFVSSTNSPSLESISVIISSREWNHMSRHVRICVPLARGDEDGGIQAPGKSLER